MNKVFQARTRAVRDGDMRAMFHAYNDASDVGALIEGLMANRELLA